MDDFITEIDKKCFGDILKEELNIPIYQREYAWKNEEINSFLDDIEELYNCKEKQHFFGQIVIHYDENNKKYNIIDGQQRVITTTIMINNIQYLSKQFYDEYNQERFYQISAEAYGFLSDSNGIHIKSSNPFIEKVLNNNYTVDDYKNNKINKRIKNCEDLTKEYIYRKIENVSDNKEKANILHELLDILVKRFIVIYLQTEELEKAFIIFETLNARGKYLETSDLLKNYLLMKSGNDRGRIEKSNKVWNKIVDNLDQIDLTAFIRHYWNSKNEFIRNTNLYSKLVQNIKNYDDVKNFLESLERNSIVYASLYNPYNDNTCFNNNKLKESLDNINALNAKTFYPIILALKEKEYKEKYILDVALIIENYIFRNYTICDKNPNSAEIKFANIAKEIAEGNLSVDDIKERITKDNVSDEDFVSEFSKKPIKKVDVAKYILRKINNYLTITESNRITGNNISKPDFPLSRSTNDIHLEHIMPKDLKKWEAEGFVISEQEYEDNLWKIGNLALLGKEYNQIISNDPFDVKQQKAYNCSQILPNYMLMEVSKWDVEEIEKRQDKLCEFAKKIWTEDGITVEC